MLKILRDRFISLGRDEDGAALVVTLAVFMFIYVLFAGIYAVGVNVRTRIHLQNACDAAAYSAAVVQADTLSRIATINRAMSWTYAQMSKRQMDYIVSQWLGLVVGRYNRNLADARVRGNPGRHGHVYWQWNDALRTLTLNGHIPSTLGTVDSVRSSFLSTWLSGGSFYSAPGDLARQIGDDMRTIRQMNNSIHNAEDGDGLIDLLPSRINGVVGTILNANCPAGFVSFRHGTEFGGNGCFRPMRTNEESRFLAFSGQYNAVRPFGVGSGTNEWFPQVGEALGFQRGYRQLPNCLRADWTWWYRRWVCPHRRACIPNLSTRQNSCLAREARDSLFQGERARPYVVTRNYFGPAGTITVGLVATNANPWAWIGNVSQGIFSAFNPFVPGTFCVASAKAGYRSFTEGQSFGRDYRIDWNAADERDWNLYTSDWDAVMVPVPRAASTAINGRWSVAVPDALGGIAARLGLGTGDFTAGGAGNAQWQIENPGRAISSWGALQRRMWH